MLFNSWQFLIFFPVVTTLYFAAPPRARWCLLLVASCVFYMAFVPAYILILAFTILVDYAAGLLIARSEGRRRNLWLVVSLLSNLGILGFFKYFNFFNDNLRSLAQLLHWNYPIGALAIVLPIGLSFHIFQSLSYTIEVYRGNQAPERHLGIYALYVMFYPQLVAGPIERPQNLLHQFHEPKSFDAARVSSGLRRMLWGLFKKVVIADRLAALVAPIFSEPTHYTGLTLMMAVFFFSFQIYCDFSGYSDIALGAARVMGFDLMENFRLPYYARSVSEFWTRWHISLSTWFKDYVYIPLGGNRVGFLRWSLNILIVFLVSGLWHGANWTFVVWGGIHGMCLVAERSSAGVRRRIAEGIGLSRLPAGLSNGVRMATTFGLVSIAWIFFRAQSLPDAVYIVTHLFSGLPTQCSGPGAFMAALLGVANRTEFTLALVFIGLLEAIQVVQAKGWLSSFWEDSHPVQRWAVYYAAVMGVLYFGVFGYNAFIYFQF